MSEPPDAAHFRAAASRFLTGVTVVASIGADGSAVGATVNSFTTISTRPPTVLVSLMRGRTWQAVSRSGIYAANVMHADAVDLCRHFGGRSKREAAPTFIERDGFPVLANAIAQFACRVVRSLDIADHTLFVGEVSWCRYRDGSPLAFYDSKFLSGPGAVIEAQEFVAFPAEGWAI